MWSYNSLYVFPGGADGPYSSSNLVADQAGDLYGTTNLRGPDGFASILKVTT